MVRLGRSRSGNRLPTLESPFPNMSQVSEKLRIAGIDLPPALAAAVRACRPHFLAVAGFSFLIGLLYLAPTLYMLQVYDRVLATGGKVTLLFITIALAIALVTFALLDAIRTRLLVRASLRLETAVAPLILRRMMSVGGPANMQAMRDLDTIRQSIASPTVAALFDAPFTPIFIIVSFMLDFWIGMFAVGSIIALLIIAWRNQQATRRPVEEASLLIAQSHAAQQSAAIQAHTLRALGMTNAMVARQLTMRSAALGQMSQSQFRGSGFAAGSRFLRMFVQSAALGLGALLAIAGEISAGGIIAASILVGRSLQPVDALIGGWASLGAARAAAARLAETMAGPDEAARVRTLLPDPEGRLAVEGIGLRKAGGAPVLAGVSFTAGPGEIVGVIGPSGAGKTTLAKVIAGALYPEVGTVRVDGAQRSDWDPDDLGRHFGYLPQEPSLFEGTIKENIARFATGDPAIDEKVVKAARTAGVHDLILQLDQGYDTRLGPLGTGLSAGQSQRIALARAFYGDPMFLVLDEPNAFLDAEGEDALVEAIRGAKARGATVVLVAHRRQILTIADSLLVLDGGRQAMFGPAKDVVARLSSPPVRNAAS